MSRAFGLPSVPRETMPSMFQILSWSHQPEQIQAQIPQCPVHPDQSPKNHAENQTKVHQVHRSLAKVKQRSNSKQQAIIQNLSEVRSQISNEKAKDRPKSGTKHYELYHYQNTNKKRSASEVKTKTEPSKQTPTHKKIIQEKIIVNLRPQQIEKRKDRIKQFQLVTRDLPNSAFTTYYGKPAFEAYGRANSNPNLLTHNIMPHKGENHPKNVQSYYSALIKGKQSSVSYIPRKPIAQTKPQHLQEAKTTKAHNIPMSKPDLINHVRFSSLDPNQRQDTAITNYKIAPLKQKKLKAKAKKRQSSHKPKVKKQEDDGLKFINTRQGLLKLMQAKKNNASKLAYKVTQCYPFDLQNQQKMKESTQGWVKVKMAGLQSKKSDKVSQLLKITNENVN